MRFWGDAMRCDEILGRCDDRTMKLRSIAQITAKSVDFRCFLVKVSAMSYRISSGSSQTSSADDRPIGFPTMVIINIIYYKHFNSGNLLLVE